MQIRSMVASALLGLLAQQPQAETGQFTLTEAGQQIATERYTRSATAMDGELRTSVGARITYAARLSNGTVSQITLKVFAPADSMKATQTAQVRFAADSMTLETIREGKPVVEKRAAPRGVVPFIFPSVGWMEEIVKTARTKGGTSANVTVASLNAPQEVVTATVTFSSPTQARLQIGDLDIAFTLDERGRIVRGEVAGQNVVIARAG
jgi:hypothetical protein